MTIKIILILILMHTCNIFLFMDVLHILTQILFIFFYLCLHLPLTVMWLQPLMMLLSLFTAFGHHLCPAVLPHSHPITRRDREAACLFKQLQYQQQPPFYTRFSKLMGKSILRSGFINVLLA